MEKPTGTFECLACGRIWDGSELFGDPKSTAPKWECGNLFCGGSVKKISDKPKKDYESKK